MSAVFRDYPSRRLQPARTREGVERALQSVTSRRLKPAARGAFSLLEMMIAIVILGLGLIMVATMFPIAWKRARVLTEYTTQVAVTETAQTTIELLTRVDGLRNTPTPSPRDLGSFAGDLVFADTDNNDLDDAVIAISDTRVHALHLENMLVDASPQEFVPDRVEPWLDSYSPWKLERTALTRPTSLYCPAPCGDLFFSAQVRFELRVYPPMPTQQNVDENGVFPASPGPEDALWFDALDARQYSWAVFHRLRKATWPDEPSGDDFSDATRVADSIREFDVYYVVLKRSQSTVRYARQNTDRDNTPDFEIPFRDVAVAPVALDAEDDVLLPSPWRVQVLFPDTLASVENPDPGNPVTGIPTEIEVNRGDGATADFVVDMFQVGTQFIDEQSGLVYRVNQRRLLGDELELNEAVLTLDREILLEEIDDGYPDSIPASNNFRNGNLDASEEPEELLRVVWVFPPPVLAERDGDDPVFVGKQPVVSIERGTLSRSPTR